MAMSKLSLTKVIDVEDTTHGARCSTMSDGLVVAGRRWSVINGRVDLAEGDLDFFDSGRHGGCLCRRGCD